MKIEQRMLKQSRENGKLAISMVLKNQHTVPGAQAYTEVSRFDVVLQLFQLLLLR